MLLGNPLPCHPHPFVIVITITITLVVAVIAVAATIIDAAVDVAIPNIIVSPCCDAIHGLMHII